MKYIVRTKTEDIMITVSSEEQLEKKVNLIKRFAEGTKYNKFILHLVFVPVNFLFKHT